MAINILHKFHPAMIGHYTPIKTIGDGNCLFRSISKCLNGSEEQHILLRLLSALELIENESYYKSDQFLADDRILKAEYSNLLHDVIGLYTWSVVELIFVVSAVIKKCIKSYYPPQPFSDYTSEVLTRRVVGRGCKDMSPDITIMWSQMSRSEIIGLEPNHFVPLIPANKILVNDVSPLSDDIKVTKVETCSIPANATFVVIDGDDSDYDHSETVERSFENSLFESSDANQNDELTNDQATASEADKTVTLFSGKLNPISIILTRVRSG
jgi:hypothetical protein